MVPIASMLGMAVSATIAIGVPIGLFLVLRKKLDLKVPPMLVGAAVFVVFALVLESLMHHFVLQTGADGKIALMTQHPALYVLYGIFAAGIFEETGRLVGFTLLKKRFHGVRTGVSYGIGHGGIESVLLAGLSLISAIVISMLINAGIKLPTSLDATVTTMTTQPAGLFFVGGVERIFAIGIQISLSILVWIAVTHKGKFWMFPLAIILHALADLGAALYQVDKLSIFWTETYTGVLAAIFVVGAVWLIRRCLKEERLADEAAATAAADDAVLPVILPQAPDPAAAAAEAIDEIRPVA